VAEIDDISPDDLDEPLEDVLARGDDLEADRDGKLVPKPLSRRAKLYGALPHEVFKAEVLLPLHKMRMRGFTRVEMAREFNCSLRSIERWLSILNEELKKEARLIDPFVLIGQAQRELQYAQELALAIHDEAEQPSDKIAAVKTFQAAAESKVRILAATRLSENTRIIPVGVDKAEGADDSIKLIGHITHIMTTAVLPGPEPIDAEYTDVNGE
jgi:hypothetical protein